MSESKAQAREYAYLLGMYNYNVYTGGRSRFPSQRALIHRKIILADDRTVYT